MLKAILTLGRLFAAPTFTRRRSFAGSVILTCEQSGEEYSIIPAGPVGFYVAGSGGRFMGRADTHSAAAELIRHDARDALRAQRIAA